jgi:hypothetical protein
MSTERDSGVTRIPVECPLCHESVPEETTLVDHLRGDHPKRELAAFIERNYEEIA